MSLFTIDHADGKMTLLSSLRDQLVRHGYHLTDEELNDIVNNAIQALMLLDPGAS